MNSILKNIVVAVSGAHSSVIAAMYGIVLAKKLKIKMKAVYVVDTATLKYLSAAKFLSSDERDEYKTSLSNEGKHCLEYIDGLAKSKGVVIETELVEGAVGTEIIRAADSFKADLILVGGKENPSSYIDADQERKSVLAHARSNIVNYAHCPVLVVNKPNMEALFKVL